MTPKSGGRGGGGRGAKAPSAHPSRGPCPKQEKIGRTSYSLDFIQLHTGKLQSVFQIELLLSCFI